LNVAIGTVTLSNVAADDTFSGSYSEGTGTGTVFGVEHPDGVLNVSEFGLPIDPPFTDLASLRQQLPDCAFGNAAQGDGTNDPTATLINNELTIKGTVTLPCVWSVEGAQETLVTTIAVTVSGSR
jgi:hypothetical protein